MSASECATRARHLTQAWLLFAADNGGHIMNVAQPGGRTPTAELDTREYWIRQIPPYVDDARHNRPSGDRVYFCTEPCPLTGRERVWLGLNERLDPTQSARPAPPTLTLSQLHDPSRTVVFTCSMNEVYNNRWPVAGHNDTGTFPHGNGTSSTFSFADGHVQLVETRGENGLYVRPPQFIYTGTRKDL